MLDLLRMFLGWPKWLEPRKSFWDEATDLKPGQVAVITDNRTGNQYALMQLDDFDHLAGLSNLRLEDLSETPSAKLES
jgi:hypothetical protein